MHNTFQKTEIMGWRTFGPDAELTEQLWRRLQVKVSQVLQGDINHWWTDTSEKKGRGDRRRASKAGNKQNLTVFSPDVVEEQSLLRPARPAQPYNTHHSNQAAGKKKDMMSFITKV